MNKHLSQILSLLCATVFLGAGAASAAELTGGVEIRARYDATHELPNDKRGESADSDYERIRTRVWGKVKEGDLTFFLRLANEFRDYHHPASNSSKQRFPDVLFIDNLYVQYDGLMDGDLSLKLGRQDMSFGAKRIISDGTGGDGSRSTYFDALRLTWKPAKGQSLDAFALYTHHEDLLPTAGKEHANGKRPSDYDTTGYNQNEYGFGLYWQDRTSESLGWDAYYVFKGEHRRESSKYYAEGENVETHTAGFRVLPKFSDRLSGELEAAMQVGDNSLAAQMAYGGLTFAPQADDKVKLTAACLYLSGDEDGARGNSAWHQVFNRDTGVGETIAPMFTKYAYNNLVYPHVAADLKFGKPGKLHMEAGPMLTAVKEDAADGRTRGYFLQAKYSVDLGKAFDSKILKGASAAFTGELLQRENYFKEDARGLAAFGRIEIAYKF